MSGAAVPIAAAGAVVAWAGGAAGALVAAVVGAAVATVGAWVAAAEVQIDPSERRLALAQQVRFGAFGAADAVIAQVGKRPGFALGALFGHAAFVRDHGRRCENPARWIDSTPRMSSLLPRALAT